MGYVNFTSDQLTNFLPCKFKDRALCSSMPSTWYCLRNLNDSGKFILRSDPYTDAGITKRLYMCLYLFQASKTKYVFFQGPEEDHPSPNLGQVLDIPESQPQPIDTDVCNLKHPFNASRHLVLIKKARAVCPTEFLAISDVSSSSSACTSQIDTCDTRKDVLLSNNTCSPMLLFTAGGLLSCVYSLTEGGMIYLTLLNHDTSVDHKNTYRFVCLELKMQGKKVLFTQVPMECSEFSQSQSPSLSMNYTMEPSCELLKRCLKTLINRVQIRAILFEDKDWAQRFMHDFIFTLLQRLLCYRVPYQGVLTANTKYRVGFYSK
ncbi:hypothetical protein PoB_001462700 [Plakobranchus ocellatus]|uniref:SH2 domain-containing protein n=1 Tax=Plakobranchus ocellatus TaxID=259542 RepID=A0AAV3Z0Q8_9GAST|nr:hypothetical protein PoB_001462700 [Plakobranchus ocellatus]